MMGKYLNGYEPSNDLTDVLNREGQDFTAQSAEAGTPFMLELATFAPRGPFTPAPRDADRFPGLKAPRGPAFNEADMSNKPAWIRDHPKLTEKQITKLDTSCRPSRATPRSRPVLIEHHGPDHAATDPDLPTRASGNPPSYEAIRTAHEVYVEYADDSREY